MTPRFVVAVAATLAAVTLCAQPVTIGRLYPQGGQGAVNSADAAPFSYIDFMHPATGTATLTHAVVRWTGAQATPCANAFKLKFLRQSGNVYSVTAERGPFPGNNGRNEIALSPGVPVAAGDLIALVQARPPTECGNVIVTPLNEVAMQVGNVEVSSGTNALGIVPGRTPAIFASSDENVVVTIVPVAGAVQGNFGSFFRTALQLTGSDETPITGTIVYHPAHPADASPSPSDPSTTFNLALHQTISFPDIATSLGRSGLGSIDIVTSGMPPVVTARVFNDAGFLGTSGFTEEAIAPVAALRAGQVAFLQMPPDVENFRMNIGIRTLGEPVTLTVGRWGANGSLLFGGTLGKEYPPNYFEQMRAQEFAGIGALVNNGLLSIQVTGGRAIVYATITDNTTNDSSIVFAVPTR